VKVILFRFGMWEKLLIVVLIVLAMAGKSQAVLSLQDQNATVNIDPSSQLGLYDWVTDGVNVAPPAGGGINDYRQWFWYRVGNTGEQSIDNLNLAGASTTVNPLDGDTNGAVIGYYGTGFSLQLTVSLVGGLPGSHTSDITEQIAIDNTNATGNLDFHFYQYGDFQLNPPLVGSEMVSFVNSNAVDEHGAMGDVQETAITPVPSHREAEPFPVTINELNSGTPTTLADNSSAGPGDITWAYEWDVSIAPGQSFIISKDMHLQLVPEPSTIALVLAGLSGLIVIRRKR
jgi:hypothetical protein